MAERNLDFDTVINRRNTKCLKYDFARRRGYPENVLPLWVADMDFRTSSYVEDAINGLAAHNIYGYTNNQDGDGFFEAVAGWMKKRHDWEVRHEWHVKTPGVCFAIGSAIRGLTEPGDAVIIEQPVYYPFADIIRKNNRKLVVSELRQNDEGHYEMDFEDFERRIQEENVRLFILCNPHNPVGRAWSREELLTIGKICEKHGVTVFSDEIHFDFIWSGTHCVFQEVRPEFREFTVTATSPSKTFNLAGAQQSNIFIPDRGLRQRFIEEYDASGLDEPNIFGIAAAEAAYKYGDEWYEAVKRYIKANIDYVREFTQTSLPGVRLVPTEGTYLLWLDFRGWGTDPEALDDLIVHKAKLWLDSGRIFGKTGAGFQRINAACPGSVLAEALDRIKNELPRSHD